MVVTDFVLLLIWAVALGAVVGILPGLNPLLGLIITLPAIAWAPVWAILIFWVCYITVTQYYGSVGAILFKVPGETSSLPALWASQTICGSRGVIRAMRVTAFSSLMAGMIGIAGMTLLIKVLEDAWNVLFRTDITVAFLSFVLVLILSRQGAWIRNLALVALGTFLATVGDITWFNQLCGQQSWTCLTLKPTDIGLAIVCLYALPYLFIDSNHFNARRYQSGDGMGWGSTCRFWPIAARHGVLGWLMGFVPGMGVTLSSNISAALESGHRPRRLRVMAAAESANNSSIISCTVPFLFIGLPITSTELLLDNWLLIHKAANITAAVIYDPVSIIGAGSWPMWQVMLTSLTLISILCFFLTSRFIGFYLTMRGIPAHWFGWAVKILIVGFVWLLISTSDLTAGSTVFTLIFFTAIGVWAHKNNHDIIALPISLMIGAFAIDKFSIALQLWS